MSAFPRSLTSVSRFGTGFLNVESTIFIDQGGDLCIEFVIRMETGNTSDENSGYEADIESSSPNTLTAHSEHFRIEDEMVVSGPLSLCETPLNHVQILTDYSYQGETAVEGATSPSGEFSNRSPAYGVGVDPNALTAALNNIDKVQCRGRPEHRTGSSRCRGLSSYYRPRR